MRTLSLVILILFVSVSVSASSSLVRNQDAPVTRGCFVDQPNAPVKVLSPEPHTYLKLGDLPSSFDWRNVNGTSFVTTTRNQHVPQYCGSCWAFASLSAMQDRIKIARNAQWPDIILSPQVILNCASAAGTCKGGSPTALYNWIASNGVPDETCAPYEAVDGQCDPEGVCRNCNPDKCWAMDTEKKYAVTEHGTISGEAAMMAEIYARGPIACGIDATDELEAYTGGIFQDKTGATAINHIVSVAGWGEDNGQKYWIVRNSWGTYWGEKGWFRIVRGVNNLAIEAKCDWAVPKRNW